MRLTINKFQKLYIIANLESDELEKAVRLVQILLDKSSEEVDRMSLKKFSKICDNLKAIFDLKVIDESTREPKSIIKANGKMYRLNFEIKKPFNTGRYIEVLTFSKKDPIRDMHNILASICTPLKWSWRKFKYVDDVYDVNNHEEYADDMREADFRHGYHAMVFFCSLLAVLMSNTKDYSEIMRSQKMKSKKRVEILSQIFQRISAGSTTLNK